MGGVACSVDVDSGSSTMAVSFGSSPPFCWLASQECSASLSTKSTQANRNSPTNPQTVQGPGPPILEPGATELAHS